MKDNANTGGSAGKRIFKALIWIIGIWLTLMLVIQIALSPSVTGRLIDRVAAEYIDGEVNAGNASVSLFRRFPNATVSIDSFSITYPAERYDSLETTGARGHLALKGTGEANDTLASFDRFSISLNILSLLSGNINIPYAELVRPRVFIHRYSDGSSNLETLLIPADTVKERKGLPPMKFGRISLENHPHVVYTDSRDTVFVLADIGQMRLKSNGMRLDSLVLAGRLSSDTLALRLKHLGIHDHKDVLHTDLSADALVATRATGRMHIPININCGLSFPKDSLTAISISEMKADIAAIPLEGNADIRLGEGLADITADISVENCKAEDIIDGFIGKYLPEARKISTDATLNLKASCDGEYIYSTGRLPSIKVHLSVPQSVIKHKEFGSDITFSIDAEANTGQNGGIAANIENLILKCQGLDLTAKGGSEDILKDDPQLEIDGRLQADLKQIRMLLPDTLGIEMRGDVNAFLKGSIRPSQLDIYSFSQAQMNGILTGDSIYVNIPADSINARIRSTRITLGPETRTSRVDSSIFKMMAVKGEITDADLTLRKMKAAGKGLTFTAMNSSGAQDTSKVNHLGGRIGAINFILTDANGLSVELKKSSNGFQMLPKRNNPKIPILTVNSTNGQIILKDNINRAILTDASINGYAAMNSIQRRQNVQVFIDSLAKKYPDVRKDSLLAHHRKQMAGRQERVIPEWLTEEDFLKQDINIRLDNALAKYFREWDMNGRIDVRTGILMTPYFPLRNILRGFNMKFDNNSIIIDSLKVRSGKSEIGAKGSLSGLRRALLGRGILNLDLDINADKIEGLELVNAYKAGALFTPAGTEEMAEATNAEFFKIVTSDTTAVKDSIRPIIVIPSNLNAGIRIAASDISLPDVEINDLRSSLTMKERCLQISGTQAHSNIGNLSLDAFYATRSKKNLKAGFSLGLNDIPIDRIIDLIPATDSLFPMINTLKGNVNCEISATASLDTNMRFVTPSINGVARLSGRDLSIRDSQMYSDLAKKLMFKNRNEGYIDELSVEGLLDNSTMEVFPFLMKLDRYTLALSGTHNMDNTFRYHASLIRSPFVLKLGVDLFGNSFSDLNFKIGKAKYRNSDIPDFSDVIDKTQYSLLESIRGIFEKGVDAVISENEMNKEISDMKERIGYVEAVDQQLEGLSEQEQKQFDTERDILKETEETQEALSRKVEELLNKNNQNEQPGIH